jgi:AcrR family transcriptional regulator
MKEDTRNRILESALDLSRQYGFWSFKVEDILQNAHISRATFYKYFKNVHDVLYTIMDDASDRVEARIREAVEKESQPYDKLRVFVSIEITGMRDFFQTLNIRMGETDGLPSVPRHRIEKRNERDLRIIREILSEGEHTGSLAFEDLDLTARAVMGIAREIGLKSIMENKDMQTVDREIGVMLGALFFGISVTVRR